MRTAAAESAIAAGDSEVWLLTLTLRDGRALRFATRTIDVPTRSVDGGPFAYAGLIAEIDEYIEEIDLFALEGASLLAQARLTIITSDDLAGLVADWQYLSGATAELALIWRGEQWHRRLVILRGLIQAAQWGRAGEASQLTLESAPARASAAVGDSSRDVGADFAGAVDTDGADMTSLDGVQYPTILGAPRSAACLKVGDVGGSNRLVLCGHPLPGFGNIDVREDGAGAVSYAVGWTTANGGYSYVQSATEFKASNGAYSADFALGGIGRADAVDLPTTSAADMVRYLLDASGLDVDWPRSRACLQRLGAYQCGLALDEAAPALDILREQLLPWLPVLELATADGVWLVYADPFLLDSTAELVLGQNVLGRLSTMALSDVDAISNAASVAYFYEESTGEYASTAILDSSNDGACLVSEQVHGPRPAELAECACTWSEATAMRFATLRARKAAFQRRSFEYLLSPDLYWLRAGMGVKLTDADYGIDGERAYVRAMRRGAVLSAVIELIGGSPAGHT